MSTNAIDIDAEGVDIDTTVASESGIKASHAGHAGIDVRVLYKEGNQGQIIQSDIDTTGAGSHGIQASHAGTGNVNVYTTLGEVTTTGPGAHGITAEHTGATGSVAITEHTTIRTEGKGSHGIFGETSAAGRLSLSATGRSITTTGATSHGVWLKHNGVGALDMTLEHTTIATRNDGAHGVYGLHAGTGDINIRFESLGFDKISTKGPTDVNGDIAIGIFAEHRRFGNITIEASNGTIATTGAHGSAIRGFVEHFTRDDPTQESVHNILIKTRSMDLITSGPSAHGIAALYRLEWNTSGQVGSQGEIRIDARGGTIEADGKNAMGIIALNSSNGDVVIDARDLTIRSRTYGIYGQKEKGASINAEARVGDVTIYGEDLSVETADPNSKGIVGWVKTDGDVKIEVVDTTIDTKSTEFIAGQNYTDSHGIWGVHQGIGDIDIDARGGSLTTAGAESRGIYGIHTGNGHIVIDTHAGHTITTTGPKGHGILAYHLGSADTRSMAVTVGGSVGTRGAGAQGVRVGTVNANGEPQRVAVLDEEGYRKQTVTVNGSVKGNAAGVFLAGGGRVVIGRRGSIGATSRIAILATGDTPGDPVITPKLRVDMNLDGRRVAQALGENWILNDGGETTIAVNRVVLHDGATGVTGRTASNGAWNVRMRAEGVTVTDRTTDPANWVVTDPAENVVADRDFSAQDFNERRKPPPPPPPSCPDGQVGTPPNCMSPPPPSCPDGQVGTPPNCMSPPPPSCPDGQVGTPPNCMSPPPPSCPDGQVGTPPNCMSPPPPSCPDGQVGTPPNCMSPPPPNCPDGQVGTPPNCIEPEPEQPMFMEEYAPRAAVYEALPDFLLRLTGLGPARTCGSVPDEPVWVRFAGGQGSYEADRSTTGATYNLERFETEGGVSAAFNDTTKGWVSVRHVWGSAGIGSPTGGGQIDVRGLGSSVGGAWQSATGAYAKGCFSYMAYNVDFASHQRGLLKAGTNGRAYTLDVEAGWRFALTEQVQLTPRVWVVGSRVSVDSFTDAVDARVSFTDADRVIGGLGLMADTPRPWGEGEFTLRGSVDYERIVKGAQTRVEVSGERLSAEATENSLLVGLHGVYRQGRFSIEAEIAARQELGSDDSEYASFVNLGLRF